MLKDKQTKESAKAVEFSINYNPELEPDLGFKDTWVQNHENQRALLDAFNSALEPKRSLVFVYAKHIPMIEHADRVLIGVGRVTKTGRIQQYKYSNTNNPKHRSYLWERPIFHSIRENKNDGFIFPYHEILELYNKGAIDNAEPYIAYAPNWKQFSYGSELVDNDSAIDAILNIREALVKCGEVLSESYDKQLKWLDDRFSELWDMRGAYPGLGPVLTAFGISDGNILAWDIQRYINKIYPNDPLSEDPWAYVESAIQGKSLPFQSTVTNKIGDTAKLTCNQMIQEKKEYIRLISRLSISNVQAEFLYNEKKYKQILKNPYLLYEINRYKSEALLFSTVDKALFPPKRIQDRFPLQGDTLIQEPNDQRRVRALVINILESTTAQGSTVTTEDSLIEHIKCVGIEPTCPMTDDILQALKGFLVSDTDTVSINMRGDTVFYKLKRYQDYKEKIAAFVNARVKSGRSLNVSKDWESVIENNQTFVDDGDISSEQIMRGKFEKISALHIITNSRFSVLIGPAGSGKTTLLKLFCEQPEISSGGILRLAPTGKARVQLGAQAKTIAQFLLDMKRYDGETGRFFTNVIAPKYGTAETVIVDEASMVTEDHLAALIDAITNVKRFIFVGDYRQLPPIGAGKPFFDIVQELKPSRHDELTGPGYAELRTTFRQGSNKERIDTELALLFSDSPKRENASEVFYASLDSHEEKGSGMYLIRWDTAKNLQKKLSTAFKKEFNMDDEDDYLKFEQSYGGNSSGNQYNYFNRENAIKTESWQILSPVRNYGYGTRELNRYIQVRYRKGVAERSALRSWERPFPKPFGDEGILYGDKVINVRNNRYYRKVYPEEPDALKYFANGEIGLVTGACTTKIKREKPINVTFSSQNKYSYTFYHGDFHEDSNFRFELALCNYSA